MEQWENLIAILSELLSTANKRHITGGILLSVSALLGGLALTIMTIHRKEDDYEP